MGETEEDDEVLQHSRGLLWRGLGLLARRNAVREGDGRAMLSYWRMDMCDFWNNGHDNYVIIGHKMLACE